MCVLLLFNRHETLSLEQMAAATGTEAFDLQNALQPLCSAACRVLEHGTDERYRVRSGLGSQAGGAPIVVPAQAPEPEEEEEDAAGGLPSAKRMRRTLRTAVRRIVASGDQVKRARQLAASRASLLDAAIARVLKRAAAAQPATAGGGPVVPLASLLPRVVEALSARFVPTEVRAAWSFLCSAHSWNAPVTGAMLAR